MAKTKEYQLNDVTVVWEPSLCIHSKKCVHGLPEVFKPTEKPWVQPENTTTNALKATIDTCPSGALRYYIKGQEKESYTLKKETENTKVEVLENGPLMVHGSTTIIHTDGSIEEKQRTTAFCRCGKTGTIPFCDGSHKQ